MRFYSQKQGGKIKKHIFKAPESTASSFASVRHCNSLSEVKNVFADKTYKLETHPSKFKKSLFACSILCVLFIFIFVSIGNPLLTKAENVTPFEPIRTSIEIYPSQVSSTDWNNIDTLGSQDLHDQSIFQEFNTTNSAYITVNERRSVDRGGDSSTQEVQIDTVQVEEQENLESGQGGDSAVTLPDTEAEVLGSESTDEVEVESAQENEQLIYNNEINHKDSYFNVFRKAVGNFLFAQAEIIEPVGELSTGAVEEQVSETVIQSAEITTDSEPTSDVTIVDDAVLIGEESIQAESVEGSDGETAPTDVHEVDDVNTSLAEKMSGVSLQQNSYELTLHDFGIPELESGQFIDNLQLRLSLAGQYANEPSDAPAYISVDYSFGDFARDAGSILIDEETSNAINGGYYLIPLPSITDISVLSDLSVTISFVGDTERLKSLFIDSVWLEAGTVTFSKDVLEERFSNDEMLKHLEGLKHTELVSDKLDFLREELPRFNLKYTSQQNFFVRTFRYLIGSDLASIDTVQFKNSGGDSIGVTPEFSMTDDGLVSVVMDEADKERLKPGLYTVEIQFNEGGHVTVDTFEFQWGLLSINSNQTEYSPHDTAEISMGALSSNGNTLCDAKLNLYVVNPNGFITIPPVVASGQCYGNNVTDVPDFSTQFTTDIPGVYEMYLERVDDVGNVISHTSDTFLVAETQQVALERNGPTRIYPPSGYPMELTVHGLLSSFTGELIERVPANFTVYNTDAEIRHQEAYIELVWPMDVPAGESRTVSYSFDAPDLSPYLYELGPAQLVGDVIRATTTQEIETAVDDESTSTDEASDILPEDTAVDGGEDALVPDTNTSQEIAPDTPEASTTPSSEAVLEASLPSVVESTFELDILPVNLIEEILGEPSEVVPLDEPAPISLFKPVRGEYQLAQVSVEEPVMESTTVISVDEVTDQISVQKDSNVVFLEHRQWQIASDATGNMILYWDNAVSIPTGWTCLSCGSGSFFQNFAQGNSTYNTTGGATTHTHTATGVVTASALATIGNGGGNTTAVVAHTHTYSPTISAGSNLPLYRQLRVIQYTDGAGEPEVIPAGAIGIFDVASSSLPSGWTRYSAQDGYYIRGENTPGTTGGSNTHSHTVTGTTGNSAGGTTGGGNGTTGATATHNHTLSTSTSVTSTEPPYINVVMGKITADGLPPNNLIAMWTDTVPSGWTDVSSAATSTFYGKFMKASTTYGATGGGTNHNHPNITNASSSAPSATVSDTGGALGAGGIHTHKISVTGFSSPSHLPPYLTVIVGKRANFNPFYSQTSFRWYVNDDIQTPSDIWPLGGTNIAQGEAITATSSPVKNSEVVRLRMNTTVLNATSSAGSTFKLQYGLNESTCNAIASWSDVGTSTASTIWRGYDTATPVDHSTLSSTLLTGTTVAETYEENGYATSSPTQIPANGVGEWDFVLQNNGATPGANYCFRMIQGDDAPFFAYTDYPRLITDQAPNTPTLIAPFDNNKSTTTRPTFSFSATDSESDRLEYELTVDDNYDFSSPATTTYSSNYPSDTGWASSTFASGATTTYTIQAGDALTDGVTYWWRVRTRDPIGSNTWSATSTTRSITIDTSLDEQAWFQSLGLQFEDGTLSNISTTTGSVALATTSRSVPTVVSGWTSNTAVPGVTLTLTKPSNVEAGDLLLIIVGNDDTTNTDQWDNATLKPTGFTLINESGNNANSQAHSAAFYRVADGTESATINVPAQISADFWGYYVRVTGASTTNPINVTGADYNGSAALNHVVPSVTTTQSNALAFYVLSGDGGDVYPFTVSGTGWSESAEIQAGTGAGNTAGVWGTRSMTTTGATGNATVGLTVSDSASGFQFAINPSNARGSVMSPEIDFDWVQGQADWGDVIWNTTEPTGTDVRLRVYYSSTTVCDSLVPDSVLTGNSTGFDVSQSGFWISALATTTYNRICVKTTLELGTGTTTPTLNDWAVGWVVPNQIPYTPILHITPAFEYQKSTSTQPTLGGFASTDYENNALEYEIIVDDDYTLTSPIFTKQSFNYPTDTGWNSATFSAGATTTYTVQSGDALTSGNTYWWAVRARDPLGTNMWSPTSTVRSVTISTGNAYPEWYQTTEEQFKLDGLSNATTSGGGIEIETLGTAATNIATQSAWSQQYANTTYPSGVVNATYSVGAGTNRVLVVAIASTRSTAGTQTVSVSYGGRALTQATGDGTNATNVNHSYLFYLNDADIVLATSTQLSVTVSGGTSYYTYVYASVFTGVDQSAIYTDVRNYFSGATANATVGPFSAGLTIGQGGQAIEIVNLSRSAVGNAARTVTTWSNATWPNPSTVSAVVTPATNWGVGLHINNRNATTSGTEASGHTANSANTFDSMSGMSLKVSGSGSVGSATSTIIDHDFLPNQNTWGEIEWDTTEPSGSSILMRVYYASTPTSTCNTIVPGGALPGNAVGYSASQSPLDISGLATSTYNRICLVANFTQGSAGSSPILNDWSVRWTRMPQFIQQDYRWYQNIDAYDPTTAWISASEELLENEPIDIGGAVLKNDVLRLRMSLTGTSTSATIGSASFKLQFAEGETCTANLSWNDVGDTASTTALWRGYNNPSIADATAFSSTLLASSTVIETYEERNNSYPNPIAINTGENAEWDWTLYNNLADPGTTYCFRMINSDGSTLRSYSNYPSLITNSSPVAPVLYTPFDNEKLASTSPWFEFVTNDPEGDEVDYHIQIDDDPTFGSTAIDTESESNLDDFVNIGETSDKTPFNNFARMRYIVPPAILSNSITYWWRVQSKDVNGSENYGEWSAPYSFTITSVSISTWFQTTEAQFDTNTLVGTNATAGNLIAFASGSTTGTTTSSAIDFSDGRTGNAWGSFTFNETGSANDILYHFEYYLDGEWALIPDSALTGNTAGYDTSPVDLIDLDSSIYDIIRIRANFRSGAPTLLDWTVTWGERVSVSTHHNPFNNEKFATTTPTFTFYSTDPQGQDLEYEVSWSTDYTFATGSTTRNSSTSPTGFTNLITGGDTLSPFISGDTIAYKVQPANALTASSTYWWRVRAKDPSGSNSFSFWSEPWSLTTATSGEPVAVSTWHQTLGTQFDTGVLTNVTSATGSVSIGGGIVVESGWTSNTAVPNSSLTITKPTGVQVGDLLLIIVGNDNTTNTVQWNNTTLKPSGFTLINETGNLNPDAHTAAFYRFADGTENSSFIVPAQSSANYWGYCIRVTGVDTTSPLDVTGADYNSSATNSFTHIVPGITTTDDNGIAFYVLGGDGGDTYPFSVAGTGWVESAEIQAGTLGTNAAGTWGTRSMTTAGATGDATVTMTASDGASGFQFSLTPAPLDSGTLTSPTIDFDDGSGPVWGQVKWRDIEPGSSELRYQVQYLNSSNAWVLIPDSALTGNSAGFTVSPIALNTLDTTVYNEIRILADFNCAGASCPTLNDWTVEWSRGFSISGTALEYDGIASTTSGTVGVAVNGELQLGKTGSIQANGTWTIDDVTFFAGDAITVFVTEGADADEAVAVTTYDGSPNISGMRLQKRHLTIGSDDHSTITQSNLGMYDDSNDEDLFFDVNVGNDLTLCADAGCGDAGIVILPYNTYSPGMGTDIVTHDFRIDGTFVSGANTIRVNGSWDNNATTTMTGSTVTFTATSTSEIIDSTGALYASFNNLTLGETSGTATWTLSSTLDVNGNLSVPYGTLSRNAISLTIAGNLTLGAGGAVSGLGTTTFDGINPSTWTDNSASLQNSGHIVVDGSIKSVLLGSNVKAQSITIGSDDTLDVTLGNYDITVYENWNNYNTFTARGGEVIMMATTTNRTITAGGDAFNDLTFNGAGGAWSFTEADLLVSNDFRIGTGTVTLPTGTTTLAGSWNSVGGTFAHNNSVLLFTSGGTETISASGTPFTNNFYDLTFNGTGSFRFLDTSATTSRHFRILQGTVIVPSANLSIGGSYMQSGGTLNHNSGTVSFVGAGTETIDVGASSFNSLAFSGSGSWSFIDSAVTALGSVWVTNGTLTLPSGTLTVGGSYGNWATVTHNSGTVVFNSTDVGETIYFGSSALNHVTLSSATGGWTITESGTTTGNFTLTALASSTLLSGKTLAVGGVFTNSVGGASTTWTGSTLSLEAGNYSLNTKTNTGDIYGILKVKSNTDIKMWNSSATTYEIDATGSLYSQDHSGVDGNLYIFGGYERTSGAEYWSHATDFDGVALSGSTTRTATIRFDANASATFTSGTVLNIIGTTTATTSIDKISTGNYGLTISSATINAQYYQFKGLNATGLNFLGSSTISSLANGDFEVSAASGTAMTVSSTTIDANAGLPIYRVNFTTTLSTSTPSDWLAGWEYRKSHTITAATGAGTNYQMKVVLRYGAGTDSGSDIYLNSRVKTDFSDIRFTASDGTTTIDYWVASSTSASVAEVWVEIPADLSTTNQTIYVYYGNTSASYPYLGSERAHGDATFLFFDDFSVDLTRWKRETITGVYPQISTTTSPTYVRNGGGITTGNYGFTSLGSNPTYTGFNNNAMGYKARSATDAIGSVAFRGSATTTNTGYQARFDQRTGQGQSFLRPPYSGWNFLSGCTADANRPTADVWYSYDVTASSSNFSIYRNGTLMKSCSDATYASPGQISLQNHYGSYVDYDWVFVRKFQGTEPAHGSWGIEEPIPLSSGTNVTAVGTSTSYWRFWEHTGALSGEAYDNDPGGNPGYIRWDDSALTLTVSGTVYSDDGVTTMGSPTCNGSTANVTVVVTPGIATSTSCSASTGAYSINVPVVGDVVLTTYLNTNGGQKGVVVTKTPTENITNHNIYANRVITKHEDVLPLTIIDMARFDSSDDSDIPYTAASGTVNTLVLPFNTELHIASSTTFAPGGDITIAGNGSTTSQDGSLHIDDNATFTGSATSTYTFGGSFTMDIGATFTSASTTVIMNATTSGKAITTASGQEISFNNLQFTGVNGGWNINGNIRALGNIDVATGTVSGTSNITLPYGSFVGDGTVSLGLGTTTIERTNTLGGIREWTFANLVLGSASTVGTTTPASNATTTILGKLTVENAHYLNAGGSGWNLRGSGTVFVVNGSFLKGTSTILYSGALNSNILSTNYYNLNFGAYGGTPTYTATGVGVSVQNNLTVGGSNATVVNFDTNDVALNVDGSVNINTNGNLVGSNSGAFTVARNWTNTGSFTHSNGRVVFDATSLGNVVSPGGSPFYDVDFDSASGGWTVGPSLRADRNLSILNAQSFVAATSSSGGGASWYDIGWSYRKSITIDHTKIGSTSTSTLVDFPVLINTTNASFKYTGSGGNVGKSNGGDLLFTASDGITKLSHEIEKYSSTTGELVAWVRIPVLATSTDTELYIYYGNESASDQWNITGTWNDGGSNYFKGIYHMKEATGTNPGDSSPSGNNGTQVNSPSQTTGQIGGSLLLNGTNQNIDTTYTQSNVTSYTVGAWIKTTDAGTQRAIVQNRGSGAGQSLTLGIGTTGGGHGGPGRVGFEVDSNTIDIGISSVSSVNDGNWHYVVGTWSAATGTALNVSQFKIYIDGALAATTSGSTGSVSSPLTGLSGAKIGRHESWATYLAGTVDEVRMATVVRSLDWIKTEYNNQSAPSSFYTFGSESSAGSLIEVRGTFTNAVGGGETTWTGSTLYINSGTTQSINTKSAGGDVYDTLRVGSNTHVRMWNSSAGTTSPTTTASVYSQDHGGVDGDLYIFGSYTKSTGTDYWSSATDFDGTSLGSLRNADVYVASGSSILYTGGGLAVVGTSGATTTIQNQGSGTYSFRIGGSASTTWSYYQVRNTDVSGLTFSGTPSITTLSNGNFEVSQNGGSAITVGGSAIQVRTFTNNYFGTGGASPAYNVTATGTTLNSWKFTTHSGAIAGESYDVDPGANGGDPGYIVWDNSSTSISISGIVYSGEGSGISTACDGTDTLKLVVGGITQYATSCNGDGSGGGTGAYTFTGISFNIGDSFVVYIDGQTEKAATVSEDTFSTISNFDLYENRVIVRHEGVDPLSIADMSVWDSTDDADVPFTAVDSSPDTLTLPANRKLIVWTGKEFEPNGNVTVTGGGAGSSYDGTLELYSGALFDATGSETHTVGGSLIVGTGGSIDDETSTFIFTTTGSARTVDTNEYSLYNATFNGSGSWTIANTSFDIGNDLTISQGAVTLPSGTTTITGSFLVTSGSFNANGGAMLFNSSASETITPASSPFSKLTINGSGSFAFGGTHATATARVFIDTGSLTSVSGTFTVGESFINDGTFVHNNGTLRFTSAGATVLTASSSDLGSVTFAGGGTYTYTDTNLALLGSLRIEAGSVQMPLGTISIGGSFLNTGGSFTHASGTVLMNSTDTGETVTLATSTVHNISFASAGGGWTISGNATATANFSLVSASQFTLASGAKLSVSGVFTNLVGGGATTWTGSALRINSGAGYTINTKSSGGDTYNTIEVGSSTALRAWDSAGTVTLLDTTSSYYSQDHAGVAGALYIYGNYVRSSGADYWSYATDFDGTALGGSSRQVYVYHASGASTTLTSGSLNIVGSSGFDTTINNQGSGTYGINMYGGTLNAQYYSLSNMGLSGLVLSGTTTVTSLTEGNFTLAVNGGSLITLASTTLNFNAGLVITGALFATTTAISGYNIALIGSTPSAWTLTSHTGNFDGEQFDYDGGDDCGSIRWDDSDCLLTEQSAYRFRNDDGGESVPNTEWYDQDWTKRKRVTVTNHDAVTYTNATVAVTVPYETGDMQPDFDDLRFTDSNGMTLISHFTEDYTEYATATVWINIPTLAPSTDTEVYMYYGNGAVADGSATTTFAFIDTYEDNSLSEYTGDTGEFVLSGTSAYERTYRLNANDPTNGKTDLGGMYTSSSTLVRQGQTLRTLAYIDTASGSADEMCTLFGTQNQTQNYAVCLELFGVDRLSLAKNVLHRDTSGTVLASTTVTYSTGWYEIEVDWHTSDLMSVRLSKNGTLIATTSATDSSYDVGGVGYSLWSYHGGWDMYSSRPLVTTEPTAVLGGEQVPGGASWLSALNTPVSGVDVNDTVRARFLVENTGLPVVNQNYRIEFAPKGASPSCEAVSYGAYVEVPPTSTCGTSDFCMVASSQFSNRASTTDLMGGTGIFTDGQIVEDASNSTSNITLDSGEYTELEYAITPTTNVTDSNYCFRVTNVGTELDSYAHVAELGLRFVPNITTISFNNGLDISLSPGATTTVYATGTVTDMNGYSDIASATTTMFRSGVTESCGVDANNCYRASGAQCTFSNCAGDSCDIQCSADIYYHADPTDVGSFAGESWGALLEVSDFGGSVATQTAPYVEMLTLRAISVDNTIDYGALEVGSTTGSYNASTTIENIGNDSLDISIEGTDLTDGGSSAIPVSQQHFATSTFSYSSCVFCSTLSSSALNYRVDLAKPVSTTPSVTDQLFWGIAIPYGVSAAPHEGSNIFYAIGDL